MKEIFWMYWEITPNEVMDKYCDDNEYDFYCFRNEINTKDNIEISELLIEILKDTIQYYENNTIS